MLSIMFFIFLSFVGIAAMLFYVLRSQERQCRMLKDDIADLRVLLRALESRIDLRRPESDDASAAPETEPEPTRDPLLHLNFDAPAADSAWKPSEETRKERDALAASPASSGGDAIREAGTDLLPELRLDPERKD